MRKWFSAGLRNNKQAPMSWELATCRNHLSVLSLIYCIWFWVPPTRRAQTLGLQGRQPGARQKNTASRSFHSERAIRQVCKSIRYRSPETGVPVEATKNHGRSNEGELHPQKSGDPSQFGECCIGNQWGIQKQWGAVRTGVRIQEERGGWEAESKVLLESTCLPLGSGDAWTATVSRGHVQLGLFIS